MADSPENENFLAGAAFLRQESSANIDENLFQIRHFDPIFVV
jgi:hypothetical protein